MDKTGLIWRLVASFCMKSAKTIKKIGVRSPYQHIKNNDGTPYMDRWWLMPKFLLTTDENGDAYPYSWCPFIIRLHHIRTSDYDRDLHDHPADYRTILIDGWYVEQNIYGNHQALVCGDTKFARAENFHRITDISDNGVWTIFIMRKKRNEWGFFVNGFKMSWRDYANFELKQY